MLRKVVFSVPVALILWGMVLWMLWSSVVLWGAKLKMDSKNDEITLEAENAEESRKAIEFKIESLRSEYGVDLEARRKFNLTKSGEKIVVFADESKKNKLVAGNKSFFASVASWLSDFFNFSNYDR